MTQSSVAVCLTWLIDLVERIHAEEAGPIADAPGESWLAVDMALRYGRRGLPGGSSIVKLQAETRNARNVWSRPDLTIANILSWADAAYARTGEWPNLESGAIIEAPGETWAAVNHALRRGTRGLSGGRTLARLLAAERGYRNHADRPRLSRKMILRWAIAHHRRTGEWPTKNFGAIPETLDDTWSAINAALTQGGRGC